MSSSDVAEQSRYASTAVRQTEMVPLFTAWFIYGKLLTARKPPYLGPK